eukprot:gnl/TRDRNA2_/TRDRNA2_199093_c0_seq1.p1 gnl/TRDRNA2_/TRDRNA2_199093_c0~~gnl/TRDRNA2_/TRDRNA2_199093_c0_seq1.p1  ORF type:complete len:239 (+),score=52.71 gnl/TRDRNA2_/TRDRNA2_199093_c0_seq1:78-794(+)
MGKTAMFASKVKKSVKKGLGGVKAPSGAGCTIDTGLASQDASLAKRARVMPGMHARLVQIDPIKNIDKYYVLQGLEDPAKSGKPARFYSYSRWGRTGTGGACKLDGPMDEDKAKEAVHKLFKQKTGCVFGSITPGFAKAKPGKYGLLPASKADPKAKWEYRVDDKVDGKKTGWYPYTAEASVQVEELRAEHAANKGRTSTAVRTVESGTWTYKVDLSSMEQTNIKTKKVRKIRRLAKK